MNTFSKVIGHFKTICKHKYWVFHYCRMVGIPWRGIVHDLSKFSPTEFCESVKYYTGTSSPIDECKKDIGYSNAWLHHRGRNPHHYEYWTDNYDNGTISLDMPFKYTIEMVCDYLGAARAYMGDNFNYENEYKWWEKKKVSAKAMHPYTVYFIDTILSHLKKYPDDEDRILNKDFLIKLYNEIRNRENPHNENK